MLRGKSIGMLLNKCMEFFSEDYLAHHGVLGMKWGVRRYQKEGPGSRTTKKLKKYSEAADKYQNASLAVKTAKNQLKVNRNDSTKAAYRSVKNTKRIAKGDLNRAFDDVKAARKYDKGRMLYRDGKTITGIDRRNQITGIGLGLAGYAGYKYLSKANGFVNNRSNLRYSDLAYAPAGIAAIAAGTLYLSGERQKAKLRAYYAG